MRRRIGILGGMFDPVHRGHVDVASAAESALDLSSVYLVPANRPPHRGRPVASSFHRFAMVALTVADRPGWHASDVELLADQPSYTSETLGLLNARGYEPWELFFIAGADAFLEIESWNEYPRLLGFANFVVVSRPGFQALELPERLPALAPRMRMAPPGAELLASPSIILIDTPTADVSSTDVRRRIAEGLPVVELIDPAVHQHIERHGLYGTAPEQTQTNDRPSHLAAGGLHGQSRKP